PRLKAGCPNLQESVVLLSPTKSREIEQHPCFFGLFWLAATQAAACKGSIEDEMAHALRVTRRVLDRDRAALAGSNQREPLEGNGFCNAFEIAHPRLKREIVYDTVRQPTATRIISQHSVLASERVEPRSPRQAVPLVLKMRGPGSRHNQRRSIPAQCV